MPTPGRVQFRGISHHCTSWVSLPRSPPLNQILVCGDATISATHPARPHFLTNPYRSYHFPTYDGRHAMFRRAFVNVFILFGTPGWRGVPSTTARFSLSSCLNSTTPSSALTLSKHRGREKIRSKIVYVVLFSLPLSPSPPPQQHRSPRSFQRTKRTSHPPSKGCHPHARRSSCAMSSFE